jgi:hypothetical protein
VGVVALAAKRRMLKIKFFLGLRREYVCQVKAVVSNIFADAVPDDYDEFKNTKVRM